MGRKKEKFMSLGNRLYTLRKNKNISQEEAAEKLGVTRQTISKWETDQSLPDYDKILPLCELYEISTEELLTGKKSDVETENNNNKENQELASRQKMRTALVVSFSVFLYFIAVIWIIIVEPIEAISENLLMGIFLFIVAIATVLLVFYFISISKEDKEREERKIKEKEREKYDGLIALVFTCIYLLLSFVTSAWHITWILWIVYAIVIEIVHLLLEMKENKNEGE